MALGLGLSKGASFVNDWDKDIDRLYQREEYAAQVRAEKERKTQYYATLLKKGHGSTPRAEKELNEFYTGLNNELADFVTANPNFETDVKGMQDFLSIQDKYLNNEILRRDLQVKGEFDKLREAASKGDISPTKYEAEMAKYTAYISPDSKDEPYVFTNLKEQTGSEYLKELTTVLKKVPGDVYYEPKSMNNMYDVTTPDADVHATIATDYATDIDKKYMMDKEYEKFKVSSPELTSTIRNPVQLFQERYHALNSVERVSLGLDAGVKKSLEGGGTEQPYSNFFNTEARRISTAIDNENEVIEASPAAVALTVFKKFGTPANLSASDKVLAYKETAGAKPSTPAFLHNAAITATAVTGYINKGGFLYAKTSVNFKQGLIIGGENGDTNSSSLTDQQLLDLGFQISSVQTNSIAGENIGTDITVQQDTAPVWQGTLLVPVKVNEANIGLWEQATVGKTEKVNATNAFVNENFDAFMSQYPSFIKSKSIEMTPALLNSQMRRVTAGYEGESDPKKTQEYAYEKLGWSLPNGSTNLRYDPKFGYVTFTYNNVLCTIDPNGTVVEVPNIVN